MRAMPSRELGPWCVFILVALHVSGLQSRPLEPGVPSETSLPWLIARVVRSRWGSASRGEMNPVIGRCVQWGVVRSERSGRSPVLATYRKRSWRCLGSSGHWVVVVRDQSARGRGFQLKLREATSRPRFSLDGGLRGEQRVVLSVFARPSRSVRSGFLRRRAGSHRWCP